MMENKTNVNAAKKEKSTFADFKAEFKKIIWPNKQSLTRQTVAVIAASVALGLLIALMDYVIGFGVEFLVGFKF